MFGQIYGRFDHRTERVRANIADELGVDLSLNRIARELFFQSVSEKAARRLPVALVRAVAMRQFRGRDRFAKMLAEIESGVILAVPHFGPFMWACVGASGWLRRVRSLAIFFQDPDRNKGNPVINETLERYFDPSEICFDDRKGMARAAKTLKQGGVCILMPDATRSRENSFLVPFLSGEIEVQPGTAALARLTQAAIISAYVRRTPWMSYEVDAEAIAVGSETETDPAASDYVAMAAYMAHFSRHVTQYPEGWRYWSNFEDRVLYRDGKGFEQLPLAEMLAQATELAKLS